MDSLVSILIPTYNSEKYVGRALRSAIEQSYRALEIIVQDNSSTDDTWEIVTSHAKTDPRVQCYRNSGNLGPLRNWQAGLSRCSGEYIKVIWSDDWIDPKFVEECVSRLQEDKDAGLIFTSAIAHHEHFDVPYYHYVDQSAFDIESYLSKTIILDNMPVSPGCALIRRTDARFEVPEGASDALVRAMMETGAGADVLFMLMAAINYKRVLHLAKFYSHFQAHADSITCANADHVLATYQETYALFVKQVGIVRIPSLEKNLRNLRLVKQARETTLGLARRIYRRAFSRPDLRQSAKR